MNEAILKYNLDDLCLRVLPHSFALNDAELYRHAHPDTALKADSIRAKNRKNEYLRGRWMLRTYECMNHQDPLLDPAGIIIWPHGYCGSLSHKDGNVLTCIAPQNHDCLSIGIDLESAIVKSDIAQRIATKDELDTIIDIPQTERSGLIFSIKESVFKAVFPMGKTMFWFEHCEIETVSTSKNILHLELKLNYEASRCPRDISLRAFAQSVTIDSKRYWLTAAICIKTNQIERK